jgi:GT2 family glycosyltransferase
MCTRNRPGQLRDCLRSILANTFKNFSLVIVDQSTNEETVEAIYGFKSKRIKVIRMPKPGKTKGLNLLISQAKSEILAFTDDDCIVTKDWLQGIVDTYQQFPQIAGIFGNVLPYQPEKHVGEICPSLAKTAKFTLLTKKNLRHFLSGNNMSIKRSVFEKLGYFQEWLGVGSVGQGGEESELTFRILRNGLTMAVNPKLVVFHNRWLTIREAKLLKIRYICGFVAALSSFFLSKDRDSAWLFIKFNFYESINLRFDKSMNLVRQLVTEVGLMILALLAIIKGLSLGITASFFSKLKSLFRK